MKKMTLENKDELVLIKLKQIIKFTKQIEDINYCDPQLINAAQHEIKTLVKELINYYGKLDYLKHAY